MSNYYSCIGTVLRRRSVGEADRIITFYTREHGKLVARAKGVRVTKSKLAGNLEPFIITKLEFVVGKSLDLVIGVRPVEVFHLHALGLECVATGLLILEMVEKLTAEKQANVEIFELLRDSLHGLSKGVPHQVVEHYFSYTLISELGFMPELPQQYEAGLSLDLERGQYSHTNTSVLARPLTNSTYKLWKLFTIASLDDVNRVRGITKLVNDGQKLLSEFYAHRFDMEFESKKLL